MRGPSSVVRVAVAVCTLAFVTNCGDEPAAPSAGSDHPTIAFATASDGNGLSITTDKDDYAPGDTVWFTGAGWMPGDTLDIVLTDTLDVHNWFVKVDNSGGFRDSTYVVDVSDLGVTFTLTATSRANPLQLLTVTFTDGSPQVDAITLSPTRPDPSQAPFTATFTVTINGQAPAGDQWKATAWRIYPRTSPANPTGSYTCVDTPNLTTATTSPAATITLTAPSSAGEYTLDVQTYNDDGTTCAQKIGNGRTLNFTVGTSDLTLTKTHTGNFTAGSTGAYTITATNAGTGMTDGPVTVTDPLPTGYTFNSASGTGWTCTQNPAGTMSCTRGGGGANVIAAGASAPAITLVVNVASNAAASVTNVATVAIGGSGVESNTSNNQASDPTTIVPAVAPASKLAFTTAPFTTVVGQCSPKITVQTQNASGGATNPSTAVTVNLSSTPAGGAFYSDDGCTTSITSRQIPASGNTADFYYRDTKAGSPKLTATDAAANLTAAEQTETVNQAATTTSISSVSPSPTTFGLQVTVNYSVTVSSPGSGTPTGNVDIKAGSTTLCSGTVAAGSCTFYPDGGGALELTATYVGDANFSTSTSSPATPLTVNPAPTTTTISSVSPSPSTFGQEVRVNFGVVPTNTGAGYNYKSLAPAGTVQVKHGSTVLCSATVATGHCEFFPAAAGSLSLVASYAGNANFASSSSSPATALTVNRAPTTTSLGTISPASPHFGQQITINFSVAPTNTGTGYDYGSVVPTGTVQVKNGTTLVCSASVATGSCQFYPAGAGTLSLKAYYVGVSPDFDGDANFLASETAAATSLTVTRAPTTTTITSPADNASYILNEFVEVDFTVGPKNTGAGFNYGSVVPTGTVQVKNGSAVLCSGALASGAGSCTFKAASVGGYALKAFYLGDASSYPGDDQNADANFLASQSSVIDITVSFNFTGLFAPVDAVPTLNSAKAGQAVPLKWRLTDVDGAPVLNFSAVALGVAVSGLECTAGVSVDAIEEYAGNSGLQNLGDGYYQFNWKSPAAYAGSCRKIGLNLGEGFTRMPLGYFQFKK